VPVGVASQFSLVVVTVNTKDPGAENPQQQPRFSAKNSEGTNGLLISGGGAGPSSPS